MSVTVEDRLVTVGDNFQKLMTDSLKKVIKISLSPTSFLFLHEFDLKNLLTLQNVNVGLTFEHHFFYNCTVALRLSSDHRVSAKRKFCNISSPHGATRLVFLVQFYMIIIDHIISKSVFQRVPTGWKNLHGRVL